MTAQRIHAVYIDEHALSIVRMYWCNTTSILNSLRGCCMISHQAEVLKY